MLNKKTAILFIVSIISATLLTGCVSVPIYNFVKSRQVGIVNPIGLLLGIVLMYYTWVEAKKKIEMLGFG